LGSYEKQWCLSRSVCMDGGAQSFGFKHKRICNGYSSGNAGEKWTIVLFVMCTCWVLYVSVAHFHSPLTMSLFISQLVWCVGLKISHNQQFYGVVLRVALHERDYCSFVGPTHEEQPLSGLHCTRIVSLSGTLQSGVDTYIWSLTLSLSYSAPACTVCPANTTPSPRLR
jgi:hypothetical protein